MKGYQLKSHAEQMADFLRGELRRGRWVGLMPGVMSLERELGVNRNTLEAALRLIEGDGWLVAQGAGKKRRIALPEDGPRNVLRVGILTMDPYDCGRGHMIELLHRLQEAGHAAFFTRKSMSDLGMDLERVSRMLEQEKADAWVVLAGPRDILQWVDSSGIPAFALFGRRTGLKMAGTGPDKAAALREVVRRLVELGHRRIVLMNHRMRRVPEPGRLERVFLKELEAQGLPTGPYNMPDWEDSPQGFHAVLDSLFRHTPPTALIADESPHFFGALQFCGNRGLHVPRQVSLICTDADPAFAFFEPQVAHIRWDTEPVVRRVVKWAEEVADGRDSRKKSHTPAEFVEGGTVGPAP